MVSHLMTDHWSDAVDAIIDGDHVVMLAYATPANGVVLLPVTNFGIRDRASGTVTAVNSSVGVWKKLDRIRRNPKVALAYHTREHAVHRRPEYVLVQGEATLSEPMPDYPSTILDTWERFEPWRDQGRVWAWWRRVYALRVAIEVRVERVLVWPALTRAGRPTVEGAPLPERPPEPQRPPRNGTAPRLDHQRAAAKARSLPSVQLGWVGADGYPVVSPVCIGACEPGGIVLDTPAGALPPGGRRAG